MSRLHWTYHVVTHYDAGEPTGEAIRFPSPAWWVMSLLILTDGDQR